MRIGLLGGSFDPVHLAHVALANHAVHYLNLNTLELIPAANPWQRPPLLASPAHRLEMLRLATENHPKLSINTLELNRKGPTYTIDTLQQLPQGPSYFWVLGSDQLQNFCTWKGWQQILNYVTLAVAKRPGSNVSLPEPLNHFIQKQQKTFYTLNFKPMNISATQIRHRLKHNLSTTGMLDPKVQQYIKRHQLYLD